MPTPAPVRARDLFKALKTVFCASAVLAGLSIACSSTSSDDASEQEKKDEGPSIPCAASEIQTSMDRATNVQVYVDDALPAQVKSDLASYLGRMWKVPAVVTLQSGPPPVGGGDAVWISSSDDAKTRARHTAPATPSSAYSLVRADDGGRKLLVAYAPTPSDLVFATYALLEELGARFFHPMQELVPELGAPFFPKGLDVHRTAWTKTRGLQPHVLHPIEYMHSLHEPGEQNLADAKKLIDWLVKTGQNHLQWPLMASVAWEPLADHSRKIADYAHSRGVTVGAAVQLHYKAALQKNYVLVHDETKFKEQIEDGLSRLMQVPWDDVELAMGEFLTTDPEGLLVWLNTAVNHLSNIAPKTKVAVQNHVGNYPQLYVDFRGQPKTYFYHLPRFADPRLGQTVHSLFWFDLYRERGMYQHTDFHFQRDFIFEELAKPAPIATTTPTTPTTLTPTVTNAPTEVPQSARRIRYFPESAYWIATDVDVPSFLPEFIEARWTDIHRLDEDIRAKGLPPLDGHVLFSSGHEWGFWLNDYLTAKMLWEPGASLDRFFAHYTSVYGSCAPKIHEDFTKLVSLQRTYLFEKKLIAYVSGEDNAVDLGQLIANITIRELRKKFDDLVTGSDADRSTFESTVMADLETFVRELRPIEDNTAERCRGSDEALAPWCKELRDGIRIVRMRIEHSILLYKAILAYARKDVGQAEALLTSAKAKTEAAKDVIFEREKGYRFDVGRLTDSYDNPTNYSFGYLRQPHTQCLWRRQDEQARRIIEENLIGSAPTGLPSCLD